MTYGSVPRQFPGETFVCLASGPSLTSADADACRGKARVIAIKDAFELAPWADVIYGAGADSSKWWDRNGDRVLKTSTGLRFALDPKAAKWATVLRWGAETGLAESPDTLALGRNSGYQAVNLAVHLGAAKIILLGYDLQRTNGKENFHDGPHKGPGDKYRGWLPLFETLVEPLKQLGVTVINCTPGSALECFAKMTLAEALS